MERVPQFFFWGGWGGLTAGMTGENQSCCTWAFENTNKCGAGLWPAGTPLCRANPLSPLGRTRVWTWAICLNLRDISSHNGAGQPWQQRTIQKLSPRADSTLRAIQEQANWSASPGRQLARPRTEPEAPSGTCLITINIKEGVYQDTLRKTSLPT